MPPIIQQIHDAVLAALPEVRVEIDGPTNPRDVWFIDFINGENTIVVEWDPKEQSFGVTRMERGANDVFGDKPDWVSMDLPKVLGRTLRLLTEEPEAA